MRKRVKLTSIAVLVALGLLVVGCSNATESCGDNQDGNTDNVHEVLRIDTDDTDTLADNLVVVCENGKLIPGP